MKIGSQDFKLLKKRKDHGYHARRNRKGTKYKVGERDIYGLTEKSDSGSEL